MAAIVKQLPVLVGKAKPKLNTFIKYAKVPVHNIVKRSGNYRLLRR